MPNHLPATTHIGAIHLTIAHLDRSVRFYTDVLGFKPHLVGSGRASLSANGRTPLIELYELREARHKPARSTGLYHFAILTPTRLHLAHSLMRLFDSDYPLQGASDHKVSEALYLADPDGNGIEIYADRPRQSWPLPNGLMQMTTDPLDLRGLLAELEADEQPWAGLDPATTIGHIHLHVHQIQAAEQFYCKLLGFDLMQRYGPSASFISAGGYHHHIGMNTWAGVDAPPPPADAVGLRFFEIVTPSTEAVEAVAQRLTAAGWPYERDGAALVVHDPSRNGLCIMSDEGR